jgi:hypothetical protein
MVARAAAAMVAALMVVPAGAALARCPHHRSRDCFVDLTLAPAVTRQIVAGKKVVPPAAKAPPTAEIAPYTGPTIGVVPNIPQAPEIGYHWSVN